MKVRAVLLCAALAGCTFGGSDEDPTHGLEVIETEMDASVAPVEAEAEPAPVAPEPEPEPGADASAPLPTSELDAGPPADAQVSSPGDRCEPAEPVMVCDPVRNTGCPPLTQCDIEPSAAVPTGRCVFPDTATALTGSCSATVVSESCAAQETCVDGACRKMCRCDDDCGAGACCSDEVPPGPASGIRLCAPC